jgi:hypothetical protein
MVRGSICSVEEASIGTSCVRSASDTGDGWADALAVRRETPEAVVTLLALCGIRALRSLRTAAAEA